jgi:hypothetical protein
LTEEEFMDLEIQVRSLVEDYVSACEEMDMDANSRLDDIITDATNP